LAWSGQPLIPNHGPHNSFNLYEGNISPNVQCDGFFGGASEDTLFRNWLHGTCPGVTLGRQPVLLQRFTRNYSVVGNIVGKNGVTYKCVNGNAINSLYSLGEPNMGGCGFIGTAQLSTGHPWKDWPELYRRRWVSGTRS